MALRDRCDILIFNLIDRDQPSTYSATEKKRYNPAIFFVAANCREGEEYEDRGSKTPTRQTQAGTDA